MVKSPSDAELHEPAVLKSALLATGTHSFAVRLSKDSKFSHPILSARDFPVWAEQPESQVQLQVLQCMASPSPEGHPE